MRSFLFLLILIPCIAVAQEDPRELHQYYLGFPFTDGIYIDINDFRENQPAFQDNFERGGTELYFYDDSLEKMQIVISDSIWGYAQAGNVYIAYENAYWRLINIGRLSHFSAIFVSTFQTVDAYGFPVERKSKSMEHLFLDFESGKVKQLNYENLESYFQKEPMQYDAFKKLKRKNQRDLILALKAYNELHPIYFPLAEE